MGLYLGGLTLYPTVVEPLAPPTTAPTTLIASLAWLAEPVLPAPFLRPLAPFTALPFTAATAVSAPALAWLAEPARPLSVWSVALYTRDLPIVVVGGAITGPRFRRTAVWRVGSRPWEDWG